VSDSGLFPRRIHRKYMAVSTINKSSYFYIGKATTCPHAVETRSVAGASQIPPEIGSVETSHI
jgi:hypothetical protein